MNTSRTLFRLSRFQELLLLARARSLSRHSSRVPSRDTDGTTIVGEFVEQSRREGAAIHLRRPTGLAGATPACPPAFHDFQSVRRRRVVGRFHRVL